MQLIYRSYRQTSLKQCWEAGQKCFCAEVRRGQAIVQAFPQAMGMSVAARTMTDPALTDPVGACFTLILPQPLILSDPPVDGNHP